jgi:hypothetical protein
MEAIADAFDLTDGERAFLLSADKGEGLLFGGPGNRAAFHAVASSFEHDLATTSPAELAELEARHFGGEEVDPL